MRHHNTHPLQTFHLLSFWTQRAELETQFDENSQWTLGAHSNAIRARLSHQQLSFELWTDHTSLFQIDLRQADSKDWHAIVKTDTVGLNSQSEMVCICTKLLEEALAQAPPFTPSGWTTRTFGLRP